MCQGRTEESSTSLGGIETIVQNIYSYQVPSMVGTNASTNKKHKLYNLTVQDISRRGDCATKFGALCAGFFDMVSPVKTEVENGPIKIFNLRGQSIDTSDQSIFTLKDSGLHYEEGNKIITSDQLTVA